MKFSLSLLSGAVLSIKLNNRPSDPLLVEFDKKIDALKNSVIAQTRKQDQELINLEKSRDEKDAKLKAQEDALLNDIMHPSKSTSSSLLENTIESENDVAPDNEVTKYLNKADSEIRDLDKELASQRKAIDEDEKVNRAKLAQLEAQGYKPNELGLSDLNLTPSFLQTRDSFESDIIAAKRLKDQYVNDKRAFNIGLDKLKNQNNELMRDTMADLENQQSLSYSRGKDEFPALIQEGNGAMTSEEEANLLNIKDPAHIALKKATDELRQLQASMDKERKFVEEH